MMKRNISLQRSEELRAYNLDYETARDKIPIGDSPESRRQYEAMKAKLLELLDSTEEDWADWKWQFANRIDNLELLEKLLPLTPDEKDAIREVSATYRWAVTPYYLALTDPEDRGDPIRLMSVPGEQELIQTGHDDPMGEEYTNPAGLITRRYPDRLIINVTNACAMFCRHCQRRRRIGEFDLASDRALMRESIDYVRDNPEIRDVLITGGDPLTMRDEALEALISRLRAIEHVEIIRIGTRIPVTMPQRITPKLVDMLKRYHPLYLNTQFNHPKEMTPEAKSACGLLAGAGIPLGNQMVLLGGINNDKYVVRLLNHELLKARVRPYYIFHAKSVTGTMHFKTSVDEGLDIMEHLRGYTSGLAIPTYIINAPGGYGKVPLLPTYLKERNHDTVTIRTWEGREIVYPNNANMDARFVDDPDCKKDRAEKPNPSSQV